MKNSKYIPELLGEMVEQLNAIREQLEAFQKVMEGLERVRKPEDIEIKPTKNIETDADNQTAPKKKGGRKPKERKDTDEGVETAGISEPKLAEAQE